MVNVDFIDKLLGDVVDADEWEQESKQRQNDSQRQKKREIRDFWMREGDMPKLVTFLNEGVQVHLHSVWETGKPPQYFLCKPSGHRCEFCDAAKKANRYAAYAVIDWLFYDKECKKVERPEVKLFIRGKDDYKKFEQRKKNRTQGDGTLLGRTWEVTRLGNSYDILAESVVEVPWGQTVPYKRKSDGVEIEIPLIRSYGWPEYPVGDESLWSQANALDKYPPMDWSDPKRVDRWILAHLANRTFSDYRKYAGASAKKSGGSQDHQAGGPPKSIPSVKSDDDFPF